MAFLSKYNTARHIYIPIVKRGVVDFAVGADWTPAGGDVKISKDGGAAANVTNLPVAIAMGNGAIWDFSLTSTELSCAQAVITVADSATKAVEDTAFVIETFGNASAQLIFDLGTATQKVDVDTIKTNPVVNGGTITFPTTATLASTTNITAGTVTTATNLTNAPTAGDFTATMKTSIGTAVAASAVASVTGNVGGNVTGSVGSVTGNVGGNVTGSVGSVTGNVGGNVTGSVGSLTTNNDKTGYTLSNTGIDNVLDRSAGVESSFTLRQALRLILASISGKLSGAATTTVTIRDVNDTKDRIVATVDSNGNRTAITTDVS